MYAGVLVYITIYVFRYSDQIAYIFSIHSLKLCLFLARLTLIYYIYTQQEKYLS